LQADAPLPKQVQTTIQVQVNRVSTPRWSDLVHAVAVFDVDTTFTVSGPIPANTKTTLLFPPAIKKAVIDPGVLREGAQPIRLSLRATLPAAPQSAKFSVQIQPPPDTEAIHFVPPPPLEIEVPGPEPLQLAL